MTKQAELKKQAYAGTLKSRALSVLIYLIDRSNKDLTCFPAISTIAEQLHISESTVKRALRELVDEGYIKKDARFREKNKGQTSNLYTLVLFENQGETDNICPERLEKCETSAEISGKTVSATGNFQAEYINFDVIKNGKETEKTGDNNTDILISVTWGGGQSDIPMNNSS